MRASAIRGGVSQLKFKSAIVAGALALVASSAPTAPVAAAKATDAAPLFMLICHGEDATMTDDAAKQFDVSITVYKQTPLVALLQFGNGKGDRTDDVVFIPTKDGGVLQVRYVLNSFEFNAVAALPEGKFGEFLTDHAKNLSSRFDGHCAMIDPASGRVLN